MARQQTTRRNARSSQTKTRPNKRTAGRRGRAANKRGAAGQRRGAPGWVWFVSGLAIATAGAAIFYILQQPVGPSTPRAVGAESDTAGSGQTKTQNAPAESPRDKAQAASADPNSEPRFSFYELLPNYPSSAGPADQGGASGSTPPSPPGQQRPETPAGAPPASAPKTTSGGQQAAANEAGGSGTFVIQAGAFSSRDDANKRAARLTLLGVDARVVSINLNSGKTIYRVQSQPIGSKQRVATLAARLDAQNIESMVRHAQP